MLTCKVNGKKYIGQSQNIAKRLRSHKSNKHRYHNQIIKNAIAKYGLENFEATVLEFCPIEKLDEREIYYISEYQPEYNIKEGGGRASHSIQTRKILSQVAKKQWQESNIRELIQKPIICIETGEIFESIKGAAEKVGIRCTGISMALNGKTKTAGGYHWKFADSESPPKYLHENTHKKSVMCVEIQEIFPSIKEAIESMGLKNKNGISAVLHNRQKTAGGYHWKLIEKETDKND